MSTRLAFTKIDLHPDTHRLEVTGQSAGIEDADVVARHIAFQQGITFAHGPATLGDSKIWTASLDAPGLMAGEPAIALGIETYYLKHHGEPVFTSLTWSEDVVIGPAPTD